MTTHSYSSISYFENCPRRYQEVKIRKTFADAPFDKASLGTQIHLAFEEHIRDGKPLPERFFSYEDTMATIRATPGEKLCEQKVAVNAACDPVDYWDRSAVLRGSCDLVVMDGDSATVADYKSGAAKNPQPDQIELMAMFIFRMFPQIKRINGVLIFVEPRVLHTEYYVATDVDRIWQKWRGKMTKVDTAIRTGTFPEKPSGLCKLYCPVTSCNHNGANK